MNLVVGATGLLGRRVCALLRAEGKAVRAMVRPSSNRDVIAELERSGVELVEADLKDRASLDAACRGIEGVVSTASSTLSRQEGDSIDTVDRDGQIRLIDAARDGGVRRFVFVSYNHKNAPVPCALHAAKAAAEERLKASGMAWTILRASFFMEVWLSPALGFDFSSGKVTIYGSGANPVSWVAIDDVAAFAVASLRSPEAANREIEVGGPEAIAPNDVVRLFEQASGRTFEVAHVPEDALRAQWNAAGDPLQKSFAALTLNFAQGDPIDMKTRLAGFPPTLRSVRDYARSVGGG